MAVIGIGAGVAVAGSAAYSSYSSSQAQKEAQNAMVPSQGLVQRAAGTVPKAAEYQPINFTQEQLRAINGNMQNFAPAAALSRRTNAAISADALRRISALVPGYTSAMQKAGLNANALLAGHLPFNDLDAIVGGQSGRTASIGTAGTAGPATARDLGISELGAMTTGAGLLKDMVGMAESVSPVSRYGRPQDMFESPSDRIRTELEQHQLIQQSQQNKNNLEASGDPAARLQLGLQTSGVTGYHGGDPLLGAVNTGIGSLGSSVLGSVGGGGGGGAGGGGLGSLFGGGGKPNSAGLYNTQADAIKAFGGTSSYVPSVSYYGGGSPGGTPGWYLQNVTG